MIKLIDNTIKVLHVDDEPPLLDQAKLFLKRESNLNVITASSAEEGLELLDDEDIDVIVSDYLMPEMNGLDFLEEIRNKRKMDIPFIMFTGKGREEVAIDALNLGADRYLQKGGDPKSQYKVLANTIEQEAEKKEMERSLRINQRRLSQAQTFARAGNWEYDIQSGRLYWSPECEALFGLDEGSFGGTFEDFLSFVHPDDKEYVAEVNKPITDLEEGKSLEFEHRIVTKSGDVLWMRESAGVIKDSDGNPLKITGFMIDITERKKAEEEKQKISSMMT